MQPDARIADYLAALRRHGPVAAWTGLQAELQRVPPAAGQWPNLIEALLRAGLPGPAATLAEQALQEQPQDLALRYLLGHALLRAGERGGAERELRAVLAVQPRHLGAALALAQLLRSEGRLQAAAQLALDALPSDAARPQLLQTLGFLRECAAPRAALMLVQRALTAAPADAELHAVAGELAAELGRNAQACVHLRRALDADPQQSGGWLQLAAAQRPGQPALEDMQRIAQAARALPLDSSAGCAARFAQAQLLAERGAIAAAVPLLRAANGSLHLQAQWSAQGFARFVQQQREQSPPVPVAQRLDFIPVLLVGLPRSGAGLLAQLLARQPRVRVRSASDWLARMALHVATGAQTPAHIAEASALSVAQLRRDDGAGGVVIDANPLNFRHLGLAAALLPGLRVIHCRRDARGAALSLWRHLSLLPDTGWSRDFADIGAFARGAQALMAHWQRTLALPLYALDCDRLFVQPHAVLAEVHEFLGLSQADVAPAPAPAAVRAAARDAWQAWLPYLPELAALPPAWT